MGIPVVNVCNSADGNTSGKKNKEGFTISEILGQSADKNAQKENRGSSVAQVRDHSASAKKKSKRGFSVVMQSSDSESDVQIVDFCPPKKTKLSMPKRRGAAVADTIDLTASPQKKKRRRATVYIDTLESSDSEVEILKGSPTKKRKVKGPRKSQERTKSSPAKSTRSRARLAESTVRDLSAMDNDCESMMAKNKESLSGEGTTDRGAESNNGDENTHCVICMSDIDNKKTLDKCGHSFCAECIDAWFAKSNPVCPSCGAVYGEIRGNQPTNGTMDTHRTTQQSLPGYEGAGSIQIIYSFPNGIQGPEHPNPGQEYYGTSRCAFLPDNAEGQKVARLLRIAFNRRLVFTIGRSLTTGWDNSVIWNDIHHKTNTHGGPTSFGYPDSTYLNRVLQELASKGITE
jgi:deltex-like protein